MSSKNKNITSPPEPAPSEFNTRSVCLLISIKASSATHSTSAPNAPAFSRSFKSFSIPSASSTVFPTVLIPPNFVAFDGTIPT